MVLFLMNRRGLLKRLGATVLASTLIQLPVRQVKAQDFGLPRDGTSNALPALKKMLAEAESRGKGTVRLPAGRFLIVPDSQGAAIILPANIRLEGEGIDATTLVAADGTAGNIINSPSGYVQIADLTVDGNAANRTRAVKGLGANIRLEGDNCVLERVRSLNSAGYGIAVGQRRFARNLVIRDVEIVNAGSDGIDLKNRLNRTDNIQIERLLVRGFGRLTEDFSRSQIAEAGAHEHKAGVDLRGSNCVVRGLTIIGVPDGCDGLRFRPGDNTTHNGAGAHGGTAQGIVVKGLAREKSGTGIRIGAGGVRLQDVDIDGLRVGVGLVASDVEIRNGRISHSADSPLTANAKKGAGTNVVRCLAITFAGMKRFDLQGAQAAFDGCRFSDCTKGVRRALETDPRVVLTSCTFDSSCSA